MTDAATQRAPRLSLLVFPNLEDAVGGYVDADERLQRGLVRLLNLVGHLQRQNGC